MYGRTHACRVLAHLYSCVSMLKSLQTCLTMHDEESETLACSLNYQISIQSFAVRHIAYSMRGPDGSPVVPHQVLHRPLKAEAKERFSRSCVTSLQAWLSQAMLDENLNVLHLLYPKSKLLCTSSQPCLRSSAELCCTIGRESNPPNRHSSGSFLRRAGYRQWLSMPCARYKTKLRHYLRILRTRSPFCHYHYHTPCMVMVDAFSTLYPQSSTQASGLEPATKQKLRRYGI